MQANMFCMPDRRSGIAPLDDNDHDEHTTTTVPDLLGRWYFAGEVAATTCVDPPLGYRGCAGWRTGPRTERQVSERSASLAWCCPQSAPLPPWGLRQHRGST
jgi:hypothetical protein